MEEGPKYAICKEGLIKLIVLLLCCTTFALFADSGGYSSPPPKTWSFAAYIISFSVSLLFYFFHVTGLSRSMNCGRSCSYNGFDFLWSWLSAIHVLAASITFAVNLNCDVTNNTKYCSEQVGSITLGFVTTIAYVVEAYMLRLYAPANAGYIASGKGWLKTAILIGGAASFGLLLDGGYNWCTRQKSCESAITYTLVAYCLGWSVTVLIFFGNMFLPKDKSESKAYAWLQFIWSALCVLLFLTASSCFAGYMSSGNHQCKTTDDFSYSPCSERLGGVIIGFITAILYVVDAFLQKPQK